MRKYSLLIVALALSLLFLQGCGIGEQSGNAAADDYKAQEDKAKKLGDSGEVPVFDNSP
ncbi:MAG: hypothetical protein KF812_01735 [Fimbriimonadaceae bacterium]|nr:hypothetical protein [Fimbriimonadaceae bacterium]